MPLVDLILLNALSSLFIKDFLLAQENMLEELFIIFFRLLIVSQPLLFISPSLSCYMSIPWKGGLLQAAQVYMYPVHY